MTVIYDGILKVHKRYVRMAVVNKKVILTREGGR